MIAYFGLYSLHLLTFTSQLPYGFITECACNWAVYSCRAMLVINRCVKHSSDWLPVTRFPLGRLSSQCICRVVPVLYKQAYILYDGYNHCMQNVCGRKTCRKCFFLISLYIPWSSNLFLHVYSKFKKCFVSLKSWQIFYLSDFSLMSHFRISCNL